MSIPNTNTSSSFNGDVTAYEHGFQVNPQAMDTRLAFQDPLGVG